MHTYIISNTQGNLTAFLVEILKSFHFTKMSHLVRWCWHFSFSGWAAELVCMSWKRMGWPTQGEFKGARRLSSRGLAWSSPMEGTSYPLHGLAHWWCLQWLQEVKHVLTELIAGKLINDSWHYSWQWPVLPVLPLHNICTLPQSPKQSNEKSMLTLVGRINSALALISHTFSACSSTSFSSSGWDEWAPALVPGGPTFLGVVWTEPRFPWAEMC